MNNKTNRLIALLLTLAMVLPMAVPMLPVGAAETITPDPLSGVMSWDFSEESQLADFNLYQSATSGFVIRDGMLKPTGSDGEMKAMVNAQLQDIEYLSVDIIPGETVVNSGVYVGASNVGDADGQIDALAFLVESMCTGWPDAPNRIDIVTGSFAPWKEHTRVLSETGNGNALYKNGEKKPVNLRLDFDTDNVTITLSLVEDPTKFTQSIYYCDTAALEGYVGLRALYSDVSFDNLQIKLNYKPAQSLQQGLTFTGMDAPLVQTDAPIAQIPNTIEMWVKLNPREENGRIKYRQPLISSVHPDGSGSATPGDFVLYAGLNGNLWWYEVTEESVADTTSQETAYEQGRVSAKNNNTGEWMHVALTRQEGKVTLYVNGEQISEFESSVIGSDGVPTQPITFGYSAIASGTTQNNLDGAIGDVRLWSTTRTQEQICADMYQNISAQQEGLMHYWKFDEQTGNSFKDSVSGGIDGIITQGYSFDKEVGLEFSGINEAVATVNAPVDHIPQAIELWVKIDKDTGADVETMIAAYSGKNQAAAVSGDWYLGTTGTGCLRWVEKNANGQSGQMNGTTSILTGEWTHVAVVRYEGDIKFYINGVEDTVSKASTYTRITLDETKTKCATTPTLGYCVYNTSQYTDYLDGALRDVRLWDVDRTQEQIVADMNKTLTGQEEGLMHYWKLDEVIGNTFADATDNGNDGTISGNTTSWLSGGLELLGVNLPLATVNEPVSTIPKTVEMWVRLDSASKATAHPIISAYNATTQVAGAGDWQLDVSGGVLRWVDMTSLGKSGQLKSTSKLPTDQYVHVAVTREDGAVKFYINGQLDATVAYSTYEESTPSYTVPILGYSIFASGTGKECYWDGAMKDIRIWNVTRTADEIADGMNTPLTGKEEGLMHYWKLDETEGTVFADSAAGHDGTPTVYWSTLYNEETDEPQYTHDGFNFYQGKKWETTKQINQGIASCEAWVKVPKATADDRPLTIVSGWPASNFAMDIYTKGRPRLWYANAEGVGTHFIANVDLRTNEWTHVAWVCDSTAGTITCYINGQVVYTNNTIGDLVNVSTMYVGRDDRSGWQRPFIGKVADVRVWNKPLSAEQVQCSMNTSDMKQAEGLLLDLPLDESADAKTLRDVSGNENHVEVWERVLTWLDVEKQPSDYSFVIIPDQQILTNYYPEKLNNMYQWIADQMEQENVQAVINVGDLTDNNSITHWERAREAYDIIDGMAPFIPVPGNHDYDTSKTYRDLTNMNQYFPISLMESQGTECGFYTRDMGLTDDVANHWQAFEVQGHKYLVVALEFGPRDSVLAWANEVVADHPDHQTIIVTHGYITHDGTWLDGTDAHVPTAYGFTQGEAEQANNADAVWEKLVSKHANIIMVLSGHILKSDNVVTKVDVGDNGNEVIQFLIDGQNLDGIYGGFGLVAMMNFRDDGQTVEFTYYSTDQGKYMNEENQFTFTLPALKEDVAQVGEVVYTSVAEAIADANGQIVTILADTDEEIAITSDVTIDLAGCTLSNVTVADDATLTLIDTVTDDYTGEYGAATVTGTVQTFAEVDGKTYMTVGENGVYSAHCYDAAITHISLNPAKDALGYKAQVQGDEVVQAHVKNIGFNLWLDGSQTKTYEKSGTNVLTLRLQNILAANGGEMNINATAFVTLAVGEETSTKTGIQQTTTMKETLQLVDSAWTAYSEAQQTAVKALCTQYFDTVKAWEIPNILEALKPSTTVEEIEVVDQAMTVYGGAEGTFTLTGATTFTTQDTAETVAQSPYADWIADYYVSMDKTAAEGLYLAGNYGSYGWIAIPVTAGETYTNVPVVQMLLSTSLTYEEMVTQVGTFSCGVADTQGTNAGATVTVELRLTNPEDATDYIILNSIQQVIPTAE